ncbi:Asp23/Gls24 family envelope stress response protein [Streptomyces sp. NBC_01210]|uniref:Asp23/Gls24 family envelope stress response protein n=1 Tax=Streptomyces sp. NBC_01210 TaxID=2903774 RepID=UPI002E0DDAE9|nr:Asp23/Gls24 family envelope stress response protein [Streptomyces sp. NBC_01210]
MRTTVPDNTAGALRPQWVITEPVIAAVAARAAIGVTGVVRLEPGVAGLASRVARSARQKIHGLTPAPTEGVRVAVDQSAVPSTLRLSIDLVTSWQDQAAVVAQAVQREVTRAVADATGITPQAVTVSIMDIGSYEAGAW